MQTFLISALAVVVVGATFLADAVAAFPPNDWQRVGSVVRR
jgi:hypothetical protein